MAKNILVISCDIRETRAALIENGIIAELHIERKGRQSSTVGNVYLGKVTRVLPGLQAAFIDIGQERAAFLHVEDLIRPDDFDEYLAGGRKLARSDEVVGDSAESADEGEGDEGGGGEAPAEELVASGPSDEPEADAKGDADETRISDPHLDASPDSADDDTDEVPPVDLRLDSGEESAPSLPPDSPRRAAGQPSEELETTVAYPNWPNPPAGKARESEPSMPRVVSNGASSHDLIAALDVHDEDDSADGDSGPPTAESPVAELPSAHSIESAGRTMAAARPVAEDADDDLLDDDDLPGFTISDPGEPVPRAPAPARAADRDRGGRGRGRRRRGRGGERSEARSDRGGGRGGESRGGGSRDGRQSRGGDRRGGGGRAAQGLPGRISKSTPIREVVREGQEIIVQVTKDPIGTKGARCSSHISLPGRYVVYLPTVEHVGISKRIGSEKERARLREAIEAMKPPSGGLIVRTVAEGLTKKQLKQDIGYLVRLWGEIATNREGAKSPATLSSELDLVLKVARDLFTDEVDEVVIDDKGQYDRLKSFVEMFAPDRLKDVKLYDEEEPIFDEYGIEDEIGRALSRKVPLPSGGYLIIDQAEALTAIDVNTGRFVGKGSKDMEETILKTNLEAVNEIAYQLRFRNIGGLIILDLIDMEQHKNREKVRRTLEELLQKDKAKTTLNRISDLGLIEMTRKRTRESLGRLLHEPCFYCDGTGQLQSKETIAYEILREIRRKRGTLPGYSVVVNAHPAVADVLNTTEKAALQDAENRFMRKIHVTPRREYHLEQFDLQGK